MNGKDVGTTRGAVVADAKHDLDDVVDEVRSLCEKCKSSIWALFCN